MDHLSLLRRRMVERQLAARGVRDTRVLDAMRIVPREDFVPSALRAFAYDDAPLPIGLNQTISQPWMVASMIEAADVCPGDRVLEVGAGSGYAAAVLGLVAHEVWSIERHPALAQQAQARLRHLEYHNVHVVSGDGTQGLPEQAPFDVIVVSAAGPEAPRALLDQMTIGGRMVIPLGRHPSDQVLVLVRRIDAETYARFQLAKVHFVPLIAG
ncbi:MAG: protein-L-isoaspartate(D-aspartate) O-methyltransferase [Leptolyngbya sp. PLA3]|nr:MAG: protein-L-isoaspartate(D-aspartate) O-methyltransferase [Cyanobacteria bacterium CYA]MCE7969048.1 protein-L-isoaspartate(D-aspartate) O-methyltransferase [Leptolyngbya sp. PL-A3]